MGVAGQGLGRRKILAITGEDIADLALADGHQGHLVDAVMKGREEVPTAAQKLGLEARFAAERDDAGLD